MAKKNRYILDPSNEKSLYTYFVRIAQLKDRILKTFSKIESGELIPSDSNKRTMDECSEQIEEFIVLVAGIHDITIFSDIPFQHFDKATNSVIVRPFSDEELKDMYDLLIDYANTFELQFEMYSYRYAVLQKVASLTALYNRQCLTSRIAPNMSANLMSQILCNMVFNSLDTFDANRRFLQSVIKGTAVPGAVKRSIDSIIIDYVPYTKYNTELRNKCIKLLDLRDIMGESLHEGFENPFASYDAKEYSSSITYEDMPEIIPADYVKIQNARIWNHNKPGKVIYKNGKIYAGRFYAPGDIIEEAPVEIFKESDLYSENIRKHAFLLDPERRIFGFPLGYATKYRNSMDTNLMANCDYEYDEKNDVINIFAIKKIKRGAELILSAEDSDFANAYKPYQLKYSYGEAEPMNITKNIRFS